MNLKKTQSFQARMIFSILIIAGMTWALGLTLVYYIGKGVLEERIGDNFQHVALETSKSLTRLLDHHIEEGYALGTSEDILNVLRKSNQIPASTDFARDQERIDRIRKAWEESPRRPRLIEQILQNPAARHLQLFHRKPGKLSEDIGTMIIDQTGLAVAATHEPKEIYFGDHPWWKPVMSATEDREYISDIEYETHFVNTPLTYTLSIAKPIYDPEGSQQKPIGAILMVQSVKTFFDLVTNVKIGKTDHTMLARSDGNLLFCPIFLVKNHTLQSGLVQEITQNKPGWGMTRVDVHYPGKKSINGFAPVWVQNSISGSFGGHRWYIFTSQDPKETHAPIQTLLAWVAGSGLLGISLLAFFSFYATGKLVKPIKELQKGAKLIALGNLQHRLAIRTGDEIEELAMEFNEMADKIKESYTQLEKKVAQRTHDLAVRNKELSSLYTIASLLNKSLNLKGLLDEALSATMMIFETEGGMIHLLDTSGTSLRLFSGAGFPAEGLEEKSHNEVLYRRVAQTGIPISFSDDSPEEPPFKNIPFPYFITIPIRAKGKVLGTLSLLDKSSHPFIKQDLELLIAIGNQIGVAIENARLYEETKKVDQLKSDFVSKVSHEFRTPLTSIKGFVELLLSTDDLPDQKRKDFLKIVDQESDRLIRLINDVLDISKIEAGKVEWKIEPLRLEEIIRSTVLSTQTLVESKKLQMVVDIASPLPEVRGDRDQLIEVLNNLLSNAIKFTEKGKIVLSIKRLKEKEILVGVKDTGIGVPPGELTKIFEKFHQVARPEKGLPKGTGLGLAICREIVQRLGGKIWCESAPGEGSTFYFTLPVSAPKAAPTERPPLLKK